MNAHTAIRRKPETASAPTLDVLPDGSLVVIPSDLALFSETRTDVARGRMRLRELIVAERDRNLPVMPIRRPPSVRIATEADEQAVLELLLLDVAENATHIAPPNEERIMQHIQAGTRGMQRIREKAERGEGMDEPFGIVGVVDGPDKKPVAVCILIPSQWWWSRQFFLQEVVNFVHPEHRRSRHINDLLDFERWVVDRWTKDYGFQVYMLCGVLGTRRLRSKILLYWRQFTEVGRAFLWPPPPPNRDDR